MPGRCGTRLRWGGWVCAARSRRLEQPSRNGSAETSRKHAWKMRNSAALGWLGLRSPVTTRRSAAFRARRPVSAARELPLATCTFAGSHPALSPRHLAPHPAKGVVQRRVQRPLPVGAVLEQRLAACELRAGSLAQQP